MLEWRQKCNSVKRKKTPVNSYYEEERSYKSVQVKLGPVMKFLINDAVKTTSSTHPLMVSVMSWVSDDTKNWVGFQKIIQSSKAWIMTRSHRECVFRSGGVFVSLVKSISSLGCVRYPVIQSSDICSSYLDVFWD